MSEPTETVSNQRLQRLIDESKPNYRFDTGPGGYWSDIHSSLLELQRLRSSAGAPAEAVVDRCDNGHVFAKLSDHPKRDGRSRCPHCMAIGLDAARASGEPSDELRESAAALLADYDNGLTFEFPAQLNSADRLRRVLQRPPEPSAGASADDDEAAYQAHATSPLTIAEWREGATALRLAFMAGIKRGRATSSGEPGALPGITRALSYAGGAKQYATKHCPDLVGDLDAIETALKTCLVPTKANEHG